MRPIIGVDLGSTVIKVVQLQNIGNQPRLMTYGIAEQDHRTIKFDARDSQLQIAELLSTVIREARTSTNDAVAALHPHNVFTTVLELPTMPAKEIAAAIQWEAKKFIPLPLEKMSLDWHLLPSTTPENTPGKKIELILTAAPKEMITSYLQIFRMAGLNLIALETEGTALCRSLIPESSGTFLILDLGATTSNITIFADGRPLLNRNIDAGSETIIGQIANAINVSAERAKQFKDDIGIVINGHEHPASNAIRFVIDNLVLRETKALLAAFQQKNGGSVQQIILTGGLATTKNLPAYLETALSIPTIVGNPWQRIAYPQELEGTLAAFAPQMAVACGLALRNEA